MMVLMVRDAFSAHQPIITAVSDLFEAKSDLSYVQAAALVKTM